VENVNQLKLLIFYHLTTSNPEHICPWWQEIFQVQQELSSRMVVT